MSTSNSSSPPQFDVATAALEHLELLNRSNINPLEVAAQFRTLLRTKKTRDNDSHQKNGASSPSSSNMDYTYMDYLAADATHRRRARSRGRADRRSKSLGRIKYDLDEDDDTNDQTGLNQYNQDPSLLSFENDSSHLRSTIDDTNVYYARSIRHGLMPTTNHSTRQFLPESHSCFGLSKWHDEGDSSTEDVYADSAVGSDYSEPPPHLALPASKAVSCDSAISGISSHRNYLSSSASDQNQTVSSSSSSLLISPTKQHIVNLSQIDETSEQTASVERFLPNGNNTTPDPYPTINWKQLREKQHGNRIDKAKTYVSSTLPRKPIPFHPMKGVQLTTSSPISLLNYHKNQPNFQRRIEQFSTTKTTSNRPSRPRAITTDLSQALQASTTMTTSSLTTVSAMSAQTPSESESFTYPNVSELRKTFEQNNRKPIPKPLEMPTSTISPTIQSPLSSAPSLISTGGSRSPSSSSSASSVCKSRSASSSSRSSNEIRTPSISPTSSPRPSYTISRLNASSMNNNEDFLFPIADCNLVIKHKATGGPRKPGHYQRRPSSPHPHSHSDHFNHMSNSMYSISSGYTEEAQLSGVCNENELLGASTDDAVYV